MNKLQLTYQYMQIQNIHFIYEMLFIDKKRCQTVAKYMTGGIFSLTNCHWN